MESTTTKIQISGATLASLLHRSSSSSGDLHGHLFGHSSISTTTPLSDHPTTTSTLLTITITSFISLPSHLPLRPTLPQQTQPPLLGWFSSRRKTPLRPSLKDSTTTQTLTTSTPPLFLLVTTPFHDQLIHTHEYKVFQCKGAAFEAMSLTVVNIGPSFRSQYDSFTPTVGFPALELVGSNAMAEDEGSDHGSGNLRDQKVLDGCAEGFEVGRLSRLMGSEVGYTGEIEELYERMLAKVEGLSRLVEQTNAQVVEQDNHNMKLRYRVAGLE